MNLQDKIIRDIWPDNSYLVGGAVRDELAGIEPKDRDYVVTDRHIKNLIRDAAVAGYSSMTNIVNDTMVGIRIWGFGLPVEGVEVSPPRREKSTGPKHTDFVIEPIPVEEQTGYNFLEKDLGRRDYTVNAIAKSLKDFQIIDPYNGQVDLYSGRLRLVNGGALLEDPLRILRGMYLVSRLGMHITPSLSIDINQNVDLLNNISAERIGGEIRKIILGNDPASACKYMFDLGIFDVITPELQESYMFDQENIHHDLMLHDHLLNALDNVKNQPAANVRSEDDEFCLRFAALLHDVGKPFSAWRGKDGKLHYYRNEDFMGQNDWMGEDHAIAGSSIAVKICDDLKYSHYITKRINRLIYHHMISPEASKRASRARRWRAEVNDDSLLHDIIWLREADTLAKGVPNLKYAEIIEDFHVDVETAIQMSACFPSELVIDGNDLLEAGWQSGPAIGQFFKEVIREVIGQPELNNREWLMSRAGNRRRKLEGKAIADKYAADLAKELKIPWP